MRKVRDNFPRCIDEGPAEDEMASVGSNRGVGTRLCSLSRHGTADVWYHYIRHYCRLALLADKEPSAVHGAVRKEETYLYNVSLMVFHR